MKNYTPDFKVENYHVKCFEVRLSSIIKNDHVSMLKDICRQVEDDSWVNVLVMDIHVDVDDHCGVGDEDAINTYSRYEKSLRILEQLDVMIITILSTESFDAGSSLFLIGDYRIARRGRKLNFLSATLGIVPSMTFHRLIQNIGLAGARKYCLLGGAMTVSDALEMGVLDELADSPKESVISFLQHTNSQCLRNIAVRRRLMGESTTEHYDDIFGMYLAAQHRNAHVNEELISSEVC